MWSKIFLTSKFQILLSIYNLSVFSSQKIRQYRPKNYNGKNTFVIVANHWCMYIANWFSIFYQKPAKKEKQTEFSSQVLEFPPFLPPQMWTMFIGVANKGICSINSHLWFSFEVPEFLKSFFALQLSDTRFQPFPRPPLSAQKILLPKRLFVELFSDSCLGKGAQAQRGGGASMPRFLCSGHFCRIV